METNIQFRGKTYTFIGDPAIKCSCLTNGRKCDQRNMQAIEDNPFIGQSDNEGYICTRMYRELNP